MMLDIIKSTGADLTYGNTEFDRRRRRSTPQSTESAERLIDRDGHRWTRVGDNLWQLQSIGTQRTREYVEENYGPVVLVNPPGKEGS